MCEEHDQVDGTPVKLDEQEKSEEHEKHIIGNVLLFEVIPLRFIGQFASRIMIKVLYAKSINVNTPSIL